MTRDEFFTCLHDSIGVLCTKTELDEIFKHPDNIYQSARDRAIKGHPITQVEGIPAYVASTGPLRPPEPPADIDMDRMREQLELPDPPGPAPRPPWKADAQFLEIAGMAPEGEDYTPDMVQRFVDAEASDRSLKEVRWLANRYGLDAGLNMGEVATAVDALGLNINFAEDFDEYAVHTELNS